MPSSIASVTSYSTFMAFGGFGHRLLPGTSSLVFQRPIELVPYAGLAVFCARVSLLFFHSLRFAAALRRTTRVPRVFAFDDPIDAPHRDDAVGILHLGRERGPDGKQPAPLDH